jgi:hypothetical protein
MASAWTATVHRCFEKTFGCTSGFNPNRLLAMDEVRFLAELGW